jgi:uncharacterized membrane-anchored protein YjiN (DUF445 family)
MNTPCAEIGRARRVNSVLTTLKARPAAAANNAVKQHPADNVSDTPADDQLARDERVATLRLGLRRMRTIATLLLGFMTLIFVATTMARYDWPWLPYLRAFAEAGMVGACADWFAVVALFRRPLGLPIPHTGIVPNNKERIGGALGRFMTNNFLTAPVINERLARVDIVGAIASWLQRSSNAEQLANYVAVVLPRLIEELPRSQIGGALGKWAQGTIATIPAAPAASKMLEIIWAQGEAQAFLAQLIEYTRSYLAGNKNYFSRKIAEQSSPWIPKWIDKIIADKVMNGALATLTEMRNPKHPWRIELQRAVKKLINQLASDPQMYAKAEALKTELLATPLFAEQAKYLWTEVESGLQWGIPAHTDAIGHAIENMLRGFGRWLAENPDRQTQLNRRIRSGARHLLLSYRFEIGRYIERVVRNWDTTTLVERLELQVGKDLQFIRINGTLVGGLVGLLIYIASKWIVAF